MHPEMARMMAAQNQSEHIARAQSAQAADATRTSRARRATAESRHRRVIPFPRYHVTWTQTTTKASPTRRTRSWIIVISTTRHA